MIWVFKAYSSTHIISKCGNINISFKCKLKTHFVHCSWFMFLHSMQTQNTLFIASPFNAFDSFASFKCELKTHYSLPSSLASLNPNRLAGRIRPPTHKWTCGNEIHFIHCLSVASFIGEQMKTKNNNKPNQNQFSIERWVNLLDLKLKWF